MATTNFGNNQVLAVYNPLIYSVESDTDRTLKVRNKRNQETITLESASFGGACRFDIGNVVRMMFDDSVEYSAYSQRISHDNNLFVTCEIATNKFSPRGNISYVCLNAAVPFGKIPTVQPRSWLTGFDRLHKWGNYPLSVSFATDNNVPTFVVENGEMLVDGCVSAKNHFTVDILSNTTHIALSDTDTLEYLQNAASDFVRTATNVPITLGDTQATVFDARNVEQHELPAHPFYVRWVNRFGGWDYFMFACKQYESRSVSGQKYLNPYIGDTSAVMGDRSLLTQTLQHTIETSTGQIGRNQFEQLSRLAYSPKVQLWNAEISRWQTLLVSKADCKMGTHDVAAECEFTFELPTPIAQF